MRILLLGEYSNVHNTLAEGLRALGNEVCVASNGDFWKDYPRDIDLSRRTNKIDGLRLWLKVKRLLPEFARYDIVQLINPMFLELKAERILPIYRYLRNSRCKIVLGSFGMDYYWVNENITRKPLRYSDFNIGSEIRTNADAIREQCEWLNTPKGELNRIIAREADLIVTGLYEYDVCYRPNFPDKTTYIPFPIKIEEGLPLREHSKGEPFRLFIGINKARSAYKGTDIMLAAAKAVKEKYPEKLDLRIVESVPFNEYQQLMNGSDAILDQLYSYTPSMNSLLAMSKGIICIGGGEEENYQILGESELRPIVNVKPNFDSVRDAIEALTLNPEKINSLKRQSREYIARHHDYIKVAERYTSAFKSLLIDTAP
jgi:glycosyltransferase involved in cell wall biosynthesis